MKGPCFFESFFTVAGDLDGVAFLKEVSREEFYGARIVLYH